MTPQSSVMKQHTIVVIVLPIVRDLPWVAPQVLCQVGVKVVESRVYHTHTHVLVAKASLHVQQQVSAALTECLFKCHLRTQRTCHRERIRAFSQ